MDHPNSITQLIDADGYIYSAAFAAQETVHWEDDVYTVWADLAAAKDIFLAEIDRLENLNRTTKSIICLTDAAPCFRKDFYPDYKGNRGIRPMLYHALREWVLEHYGDACYLRPRLEADDILGILQTHPSIIKGPRMIVSPDKDLMQIPGKLMNPRTKDRYDVEAKDGERWFYTQILTGDTVDNYPGCPGIGTVKALPILNKDPENPWPHIVKAYEKAGLTEEDALIQARCARILRASEYDFKSKEPILWDPPRLA